MHITETPIRVRYAETDRMGYVYYGNYATYFEVARVDSMKALGFSYKDLEDQGVLMPVYTFNIKYFRPAFYDDELTIRTMIRELPVTRITFEYETFNKEGTKINEGSTTLAFIDKETGKPRKAPEAMAEELKKAIGAAGGSA